MPDYDSEDGIREAIQTLEGLHVLRAARMTAGYDRKERLQEWMVLGRFYFDSCGNVGALKYFQYENFSPFISKLNDVMTAKSFCKVFKDPDYSWGMGGSIIIAPLNAKCNHCNDIWTIDNAHDIFSTYNTNTNDYDTHYHSECYKLHSEVESMKFFNELTKKIGINYAPISLIPNEYYNTITPYSVPWGLIKTHKGDIKVGWRKRVINIDWKDLYDKALAKTTDHEYEVRIKIRESLNGKKLFANEDVTKDTHMIHAWSSEKAVEYLEKICEAFGIRTDKK